MDDVTRNFSVFYQWNEKDKRNDELTKSQKKKRKKTTKNKHGYTSKEEEYRKQKPCCRANGKIGH